MKLFVILLLAAMSLSACTKTAPKCSDATVQETVNKILAEEVPSVLFTGLTQSDGEVRMMTYNLVVEGAVGPQPTYKDILAITDKNETAKKIVSRIDSVFKEMKPTLANIRTDSTDDKTQKSSCSADVNLSNGNKQPITYTAQVNDKQQIYVEVQGIK